MHIIDDFAQRAKAYLAQSAENPVYPSAASIQQLDELCGSLPEEGTTPDEVLALLDRVGSPATVKSTGGRYFGFVTGGTLPAALSARLLSSVWDQNNAMTIMSPVASKIEEIAGSWLLQLFGLPAESGFGFVTGDTMANFTALAAARHKLLKSAGWDVEAQGLFGAPSITVIVGSEVHVSVLKALSMLGFGRERVIRVEVDDQGRMLPDKIPAIMGLTIICTQAGNVNTGACDDIGSICRAFANAEVWVHVDGAFGLWAAASPAKRHLVEGINLADSWATDGHKWLNVPYDSGVVIVRDKEALFAAMSSSAAYLPANNIREPFQYVPEMSRQARAIPVWAALKSLGKSGVAELIERNCRQAVQFASGLSAAGYQVLNDVVLNQVLVSFGDSEQTLQITKNIQDDGECWCGSTVWQGKTAMRISVSCWSTSDDDIARSLSSIITQAQKVVRTNPANV